jgi:dihydroflavonol-4-reductase
VHKVTGRRPPRVAVPLWLAHIGVPFIAAWAKLTGSEPIYTGPALRALQEHRNISNEKARRELGYSARPFEDTIADIFSFYDQVGLLAAGAVKGRPLAFMEGPRGEVAHAAS